MSVVKEGYVKRHSKNMFSGGWNNIYLKLYSDSTLLAFKKQGDREAKVQICMKDVCKHFAYGEHAAKNFKEMPQLPSGGSVNCILAIPEKPSHKAKPHFFLMNDEQQLHDWMGAIISTLPARPQSSQAPIQPSMAQNVSAPMPPYMQAGGPPMPQPQVGFANMAPVPPPAGYQPQYPAQPLGGYPQQPAPGYPQQQPYPAQQPYPVQQPYPTQGAGYPQQQYYPQQPYGQQPYQQPPAGYAPAGYQQGGYAQPPGQQVVYVQDHHKKSGGGFPGGNKGKMAAGLIGGAALGYGASRMMGGGMGMMGGFGPFGMGRCGSWSSMSSFGSMGSFGSCGSFGSFD